MVEGGDKLTHLPVHANCKQRIASPKRKNGDVEFCWSCGHYAQVENKKCLCCGSAITKKLRQKQRKLVEVKFALDEIIDTNAEPEFRFRINGFVVWIKLSDLQAYAELSKIDKPEKFYYFLNSLSEKERLSSLSTFFVNPR